MKRGLSDLKSVEHAVLPIQISGMFRSRIESGELKPGMRLPPIRRVASELHVSPMTVVRALDIIEKEGLVDRISVRGVFVSNRISLEKKQLNACFAFPEKSIDYVSISQENWGMNSEFYRGLLAGAQNLSINLQFAYFEEHPDNKMLLRQTSILDHFDFAIFAGVQLYELQKLSASRRPTFCRGNELVSEDIIGVDYDREDAMNQVLDYLKQSGCRSAAALSWNRTNPERAEQFLEKAAASGVRIPADGVWKCWLKNEKSETAIAGFLKRHEAEFVFCDAAPTMMPVYDVAEKNGYHIGKDILFTGIASGVTFQGLRPASVFFRIPNFEMGKILMEQTGKAIRSGGTVPGISRIRVKRI